MPESLGAGRSPDGKMIAFVGRGGGNSGIYVTNADGSGHQRLLARDVRGNFASLTWSPDGRRIAFVGRHDRNFDIHVVNADGSAQRRPTRNKVRDSYPVWSPDGRRIAFESNWQVSVMNADGSGQRRLTRNGGRNFAPTWSLDGKRIAFERRIGRRQSVDWRSGCGNALHFEVWVMNADGSQARLLAREDEDGPMLDVLKGFHGSTIEAPTKRLWRPDADRLELRFARFQSAGYRR